MRALLAVLCVVLAGFPAAAQIPPSAEDLAGYRGLHAAAAEGDMIAIALMGSTGVNINTRDLAGRTPLHVAIFRKEYGAVRALLAAGADPNAFDRQRYDPVTIAAVANEVELLAYLLEHGASARNITSPYEGTALIAAAHLGHVEAVKTLIAAKAPLDHVNNLGWTALLEAVILGDGGKNHTEVVRALVEAGANLNFGDRQGVTPLAHARGRGFTEIAAILERAGAR